MANTSVMNLQLVEPQIGFRKPLTPIYPRGMPELSGGEASNSIKLEVHDSKPIGQGALSTVYIGTWGSRSVAVKRLAFREDGAYLKEAEILSKLSHENILKYFDTIRNPYGTLDIVLELASGVTLARALYHRRNLTTSWKRSTIYQIANGLTYLHGRGIIHLDLKPPNILFRDRNLRQVIIGDFGMAKIAVSSRRAGALKFRAPDFPFTQKSDVFSLASIACCVLSERNPGSPEETREIVARVQTNLRWYPNWHAALTRGVHPNPKNRLTAEEFRDTFERPPYSLEIPDQAHNNVSATCRSLAFVAIAVTVCVILATFFLWFFVLKKSR